MISASKRITTILVTLSCLMPMFMHEAFAQDKTSLQFMERFHGLMSEGKHQEALTFLRTEAYDGDIDAACILGTLSAKGLSVDQSYNEAARWLLSASTTGCVMGPLYLGFMYRDGLGVEQSQEQAEKWFRTFYLRNPKAPIEHIKLPSDISVLSDMEKAKSWFEASIQNKKPDELYALAQYYLSGTGASQDREFSLHFMHQAAMAGSTEAKEHIAHLKTQDDPRLKLLGFVSVPPRFNRGPTIQ